ncbi:hypothetical protein HY312_04070 [Candidatus Saccharibacteria bacterium]|nr:hypothetical protein [Candidatus Saccharibacteria bacterium]
MELPQQSPSYNTLSLKERDIDINEDEKRILDAIARERIAELFEQVEHMATISTLTAIELDATPLSPPNGLFALLVRTPYRRAHISAAFEGSGEDGDLLSARILLFEPGTPFRGELIIVPDNGNEDGTEAIAEDDETDSMTPPLTLDQAASDTQHMNYTFTSREFKGPRELIPLQKEHVKEFLDGLVGQANEYIAITQPERNFAQSVRALLAVSSDISIERQAAYSLRDGDSETLVNVFEQSHANNANKDTAPTVESYRAIVTENASVKSPLDGTSCDTTTTSLLSHTPEETTTRIEAEYTSVDTEYNIRNHLFAKDLEEYNNDQSSPGKFSEQIISGLELLLDKKDDKKTTRLY